MTEQKPSLQRNSAVFANAWSMPVQHLPATPLEGLESWPKLRRTRTEQLRRTSVRRPRWPAQPTWPCRLPLRVRGESSPCVCAQPPEQALSCRMLLSWRHRCCGEVRPLLCQWPTVLRHGEGDRQRPLRVVVHQGSRGLQGPCRGRKRSSGPALLPRGKPGLQLTPTPTLAAPTPLLSRMLLGGGQGRQKDGHTGNCGHSGGEVNEGGVKGECGRVANQTWRLCLWETRSKEHLPLVLVATRAWLVHDRAIQATRPLTETVPRGKSRLANGNSSSVDSLASLGPGWDASPILTPRRPYLLCLLTWNNAKLVSSITGPSCLPFPSSELPFWLKCAISLKVALLLRVHLFVLVLSGFFCIHVRRPWDAEDGKRWRCRRGGST